jgi:hypothetical protein
LIICLGRVKKEMSRCLVVEASSVGGEEKTQTQITYAQRHVFLAEVGDGHDADDQRDNQAGASCVVVEAVAQEWASAAAASPSAAGAAVPTRACACACA